MDGLYETSKKFDDPLITAKGERRASVDYTRTKTLWFNTGTLCNIECVNCYIESSPINDRLVYFKLDDMLPFLDELEEAGETGIEIGFTGGEPFMAPDMLAMMEAAFVRGHEVLVLTNAMQPMMRPKIKAGLKALIDQYGEKLTLRVSLDHYTRAYHDEERGKGSFDLTMAGLAWLNENRATIHIAGRSMWNEDEAIARAGYADLFERHGLKLDANDAKAMVVFPEMSETGDPPEITTQCWGILGIEPSSIMCANQRMVVKRKGHDKPTVLPCTLLPYDRRFDMGSTLKDARKSVPLNHSYCASFCVLGGGSCSA